MRKLNSAYIDTETLGLYGPMAIAQVRFTNVTVNHDAKAFIFDPWHQPASITVQLIEEICECRVVAHNLTFDWQKLQQYYNAIRGLQHLYGEHVRPIDHIDAMAHLFYSERGKYCLKPAAAVCTLLLCQKNLGGSALAAKEIRVRKLPHQVAEIVANTLNKYTKLPDILFARRNSDVRWATATCEDGDAWSDVALKFGPSNALKDVARHVLGVDDTQKLGVDIEMPEFPFEVGYAPYAELLNDGDWFHDLYNKKDGTTASVPLWPIKLREHIEFWTRPNTPQAKYALDDIVLLEKLDTYLGDVDTDFDSELACQVASVRVAGFEIDKTQLHDQIASSQKIVDSARLNVDSPTQVRNYIEEALDPMERHVCAEHCDKATLKKMTTAFILDEREECCDTFGGCPRCDGTNWVGPGPMPIVDRCEHILTIRKHKKRLQLYNKLTVSKGCFPSFRVIGTKSGRMSGTDGLNYHGIDGSREIREVFTLTDEQEGWVVSGGDMNSQELAIAAAVMNDVNLEADIGEGKSLHGVFAAAASGIPYDDIIKNKEDKGTVEAGWYKKAKICVYAILYGAAAYNISVTLGVTPEEAQKTIDEFFEKYPYMAETRRMVKKSLEALRSDGEGGRLTVVKPKQTYIESIFGFRRSFDVEFAVMQIMLEAMHEVKSTLKDYPGKVIRKENKGEQTLGSAASSALYGGIFSLQGKILRAALNHLIQSAGRTVTLRCQKRIWDEVQPVGVHEFRIKLMSVHDEIITTSPAKYTDQINFAIKDEMAELCKTVPLLSLDWATNVGSWYGVKAAVASLDGLDEEERAKAVVADQFIRCGWEG
jgi:hypothetical protein